MTTPRIETASKDSATPAQHPSSVAEWGTYFEPTIYSTNHATKPLHGFRYTRTTHST